MTSKTNILFFMTSLRGGGAEKVLVDILKQFDYSKYRVTLALLFPWGEFVKDIPKEVKAVSLLPHSRFLVRVLYKLFFDLPWKWRLNWVTQWYISLFLPKEFDTEVAFMEGNATKHIYSRKTKARKITWVHTNFEFNHYTKTLFHPDEEKAVYGGYDEIVFVSGGAKDGFEKVFGSLPIPQRIVYNMIPKGEIIYKSTAFPVDKPDVFTFTTVGRLEQQKCFDRLLRCALRCKKESLKVRFVIVGRGALLDEYLQFVREYKLETYITFAGFQSNPYPYIRMADAYINTSLTEGYPLTVCEALCLGKPIVATHCVGNSDVLEDGKYGLLVDQTDESIFEGVKSLYENQQLRDHYKTMAIERAGYFDENEVIAEIYKCL